MFLLFIEITFYANIGTIFLYKIYSVEYLQQF